MIVVPTDSGSKSGPSPRLSHLDPFPSNKFALQSAMSLVPASGGQRALPSNPFTQKDPNPKKSGGTPTPIHTRLDCGRAEPTRTREFGHSSLTKRNYRRDSG